MELCSSRTVARKTYFGREAHKEEISKGVVPVRRAVMKIRVQLLAGEVFKYLQSDKIVNDSPCLREQGDCSVSQARSGNYMRLVWTSRRIFSYRH